MTERIGKRDVEQAFISATHAARAAGLNTEGWTVSHGSPLNGISWTLSTGQRGAAAVHVGSVREAYGARVDVMDNCVCPICRVYGDSTDRVRVRLTDGRVLDHARPTSFTR